MALRYEVIRAERVAALKERRRHAMGFGDEYTAAEITEAYFGLLAEKQKAMDAAITERDSTNKQVYVDDGKLSTLGRLIWQLEGEIVLLSIVKERASAARLAASAK